MKKKVLASVACAALVSTVLIGAGPAAAHGRSDSHPVTPGTPETVAESLVSPLSLDVDKAGTAYISENFAGELVKVDRDGTVTSIASAPGEEISAVSSRHGTVYYAQVSMDHTKAVMMAQKRNGKTTQIADIAAYEASANPDQVNDYGIDGLPQSCKDQFGPDALAPAEYTGIVDTHPYASLAVGHSVYLADAGANAILRVGYNGKISTVAVLPAADPVVITAELATQAGMPACVVGYSYSFEPVPTDVELGPDGWLYVTSLPGGPEDPSLGARGSVYKVSPWNGKVVKVATGFVGATDLAVSMSTGNIYVAELFGGDGTGQVSVLDRRTGEIQPFIALSAPAAIELRRNELWVTTDALAEGPTAKLTVVPLSTRNGRADTMEDSSTDDDS